MDNFIEINFSPLDNNVIDYVGRELTTSQNDLIYIHQNMRGAFTLTVNGKVVRDNLDNITLSYMLNMRQVGIYNY